MNSALTHIDDVSTIPHGGGDGGSAVTLLVPTRDVLLMRTELQAKRAADLREALPYALEDRLAEPVGALHFAAASRREGSALAAAVVNRERMEQWVTTARAAGLRLRAAIPDALALPWEPATWSIFADAGQVLVRTGEIDGFSVDSGQLELLLVWRLREDADNPGAAPPERIRFWRTATADLTADTLRTLYDGALVEEGVLKAARELWVEQSVPLDLLGESYRDRVAPAGNLRRWLPAALLAALALLIHSLVLVVRINQFEARAADERDIATRRFQQAFPEVTRIVDLRLQAEQLLGRGLVAQAGAARFTPLLAATGEVLSERDGVEPILIAYRDGRLDLKVQAPSVVVLDQIRAALTGRGLVAEIASAESLAENRVEGQLRVSEVGQ